MKNLCFLCFCAGDKGGVNRVVASLCNELSKNIDYKIHILSICGNGNACAYELEKEISIECICAKTSWRLRKIMSFSVFKIIKYLNKNKIDVTFMIGHYVPIVACMSRPFVKSKFVFCDHGALENQLDDKKATLFRKIACKISNKVVALTNRSAEAYKRYFKISSEKVDYIYNFLDEDLFQYTNKYDCNSKKIISVGRITSEKGYDMLLEIAKSVLDKHLDWEWHIYGDGEGVDDLKSAIHNMQLDNRLILKGGNHNVYKVYKDYGLYILTSYREGLPLVLLEAKANNLPIVSFDCVTGPAEIVRDGIDGYLVECYNKEKMSYMISSLIEDVPLRVKFSEASRENLSDFDKSKIVDKWVKLIERL